MTFKTIRQELENRNIEYTMSENGQKILIRACYFSGNNFFDYEEGYKPPICTTNNKFLQELFDDPRIKILTCDECCECAGW